MIFNVTFGYKRKELIFDNFVLNIPEGQITVLCGHNGAGKTTLLKTLAKVLPSDLPGCDSWYVPAERGLIYHFSLMEHLDMMSKKDTLKNDGLAKDAFDIFEAEDFSKKKISSLSTGQNMMASIIVAFASGKKVLFLDEPFGCLDPKNADNLMHLLKKAAQSGITILATSHDLFMTAETANHLIYIKNGKIVYETDMDSNITVAELTEKYKELC